MAASCDRSSKEVSVLWLRSPTRLTPVAAWLRGPWASPSSSLLSRWLGSISVAAHPRRPSVRQASREANLIVHRRRNRSSAFMDCFSPSPRRGRSMTLGRDAAERHHRPRSRGHAPLLCSTTPGIRSVEVVDPEYWLSQVDSSMKVFTESNGVQLESGTGSGHRCSAIDEAQVGVLMFLDAVSEAESNAIIDSIQLADVDPNGCTMHETQLDLRLRTSSPCRCRTR